MRDGHHLRAGAHFDAALTAEELGRVDLQVAPVLDAAFDVVREAASGVGNVLALFEDGDFERRVRAARGGGGAQSGRDTAYDHQAHWKETRVSPRCPVQS